MSVATEFKILQELKAIGSALPTIPQVHLIRELPKINEEIDRLPCVIYTQHSPPVLDPISFEGDNAWIYTDEVVIVDGREGDSESNMSQMLTWLELLATAISKVDNNDGNGLQFRTKFTNVPSV